MSRFAKLVQAQEERKATTPESQLATVADNQHSTATDIPRADVTPSSLTTAPASSLSTVTDRSISTQTARQIPPPSQIATTAHPAASEIAPKRAVDSRKKRKLDSRKGDRHRGDKVPFNNRLSEATINRIRHFCVDHDLEQQEFAELAAIHFMDTVDIQKAAQLDSKQASDERELMILFKTDPSIINLYLRYNPDNRWKPADDYEGQRYHGSDIRLLEIGIIQTQFNARFKKVNSFKYYTTEIDIALETPLTSETIEIMLKQGRRRWQEATGREV